MRGRPAVRGAGATRYTRAVDDLLLHACCGPCSTVAVPAWRERGVEPVAWFRNPNIQPAAELRRRAESMARFARAVALDVLFEEAAPEEGWAAWEASLSAAPPGRRCAACLGLRLDEAARAAQALGLRSFATTLTVSPYQPHDLIAAAGQRAAERHGVTYLSLDLRSSYRLSYSESRRLGLYRQPYCGCAASKWEAWHERASRRRAG